MKDWCIVMNIKQKSENNNTINDYRYFIELNFVGDNRLLVLVYSDQYNNLKSYYLPKGVIKNYNVIINEKNVYD